MPRALFMSYFSAFGVKPAIFSNEKMENKHITDVMGGATALLKPRIISYSRDATYRGSPLRS